MECEKESPKFKKGDLVIAICSSTCSAYSTYRIGDLLLIERKADIGDCYWVTNITQNGERDVIHSQGIIPATKLHKNLLNL